MPPAPIRIWLVPAATWAKATAVAALAIVVARAVGKMIAKPQTDAVAPAPAAPAAAAATALAPAE